ncbi:hypothetical protein HanIR_Chr07g0315171 [Helianthus annuus]|nr:hypothetical protein HanIR_Chr07g0315171 [Helianthus annuus]
MFDQVNHPPGLTWPNSQHLVCKIVMLRRMSSKDGLYPSMTSKDKPSMDSYGPRRIHHPSRYVWILRNLSVDILVNR